MTISGEIKKQYDRWIDTKLTDLDLSAELLSIQGDSNEITERFAKDLEFGTAGLRGIIGAGINRMNVYTVAKATQGLAQFILNNNLNKTVAIGYDSRIKSELFAKTTASVLAANGIKAYVFPRLCPTPMVSYAVRKFSCGAGVMITASHNPGKYNGYKAYGSDGCQMTDNNATEVLKEINSLDIFNDIKLIDFSDAVDKGLIKYIDENFYLDYYKKVEEQQLNKIKSVKPLKVVYTPLNGAGNEPVRDILKRTSSAEVIIVEEQEMPDGHFTTCPYPNPESREALRLGIEKCIQTNADLLLATDPDSDRVGIAVKDGDNYLLPTGNEIALLLLDYIINTRLRLGTMPKNPVFVKSLVTTDLAKAVASSAGVTTIDVLTGFKYIGEQILFLEQKGEEERFLFGCEESYGYLAGSYARDKDAVVASMLLVEMASYYHDNDSAIKQELDRIYETYGYEINIIDNFEFEGLSGLDTMANIMRNIRQLPPQEIAGKIVTTFFDYLSGSTKNIDGTTTEITLPKSNVLRFVMDDCSVILRPSGTEPKIKIYYSATGKTKDDANKTIENLQSVMRNLLNL